MTHRLRAIAAGAAGAVLMLGTVAAGSAVAADVTIADKGFTESQIVAQLYAQALEAKGFDVTVKSLASTAIADPAVRRGDIDAYPEYTGTAFLTVLKRKPVKNPSLVFPAVRTAYARRGLTALNQSPYNNNNRVACTQAAVNQYKLTTLSSLGKASSNITYSANPEHVTRADGLPLLQSAYGVNFKNVIQVALNQRYKPIQDGQAQCVYAFGVDPLAQELKMVFLRDDKRVFEGTPYQNFPVVNSKFLKGLSGRDRAAFVATTNRVSGLLTDQVMNKLVGQVDLDNEDPEDVAKAFLRSKGLVR